MPALAAALAPRPQCNVVQGEDLPKKTKGLWQKEAPMNHSFFRADQVTYRRVPGSPPVTGFTVSLAIIVRSQSQSRQCRRLC
jgi:hypothetical protein